MLVPSSRTSFCPRPLALLAASFATGILGARLVRVPLLVLLVCGAGAGVIATRAVVKQRSTEASLALAMSALVLAIMFAAATLETIERTSARLNQVKSLIDAGAI